MRLALFLALLGIILLQCGCVSVGENDSTHLPWSQPASWENQTLGVPL